MKYYVVADVHGFYNEMVEALSEQGYYTDKTPHKLIVCGDLFDRGPQSKELERFVADLTKKDQIILIRGNHEDLLMELVSNLPTFAMMGKHSHHYSNGTLQTVLDLTERTWAEMQKSPEDIAEKMKQTEFYKTILPAMRNYYETEKYIFVHGWIPSVANGFGGKVDYFKYDPEWRNADGAGWFFARWYNGMLAAHQGVIEPNKTVVCGHWHTSFGHSNYEGKGEEFGKSEDFSTYKANGIIALDACTVHSRKVNCEVIEDKELIAD